MNPRALKLLTAFGLSTFFLISVTSCGYSMSNRGERQFVGGYKLVAVPIFKNTTQEPKIEVMFTNALRQELYRAKLADVTTQELAPITIIGSIERVDFLNSGTIEGTGTDTDGTTVPALPNEAILTTAYRINVGASIVVRRNADKAVIWSGRFNNERSYQAPQIGTEVINSANALYNHSARLQNIEILAKDMMREAYSRMTENF